MELKSTQDDMIDQEIADTGLTFLDYNQKETSDGGYHDVCNSLLNQIKQVEKMYKDQQNGLKKRKQELKDSIIYDIKASIICVVIVLCLVGFVKFSEYIMIEGVMLLIYGVIKILLPAIALVILCFFLPNYLKRLDMNIRNSHMMNETFADEKGNGEIITFKQEERFLKDKLYDIQNVRDAHKKLEADYAGHFDEEWDDRMQSDVNRLRKASVFREYYARGTKKTEPVKQFLLSAVVIIFVGVIAVFIMFGAPI
jgi:hypothetical protein